MKGTLQPKFTEAGTFARAKEEATYMYFLDFLEECEGEKISVSMSDGLV